MSWKKPNHILAAKEYSNIWHCKLAYTCTDHPFTANCLTAYANTDQTGDPESQCRATGCVLILDVLILDCGAVFWPSVANT